MERCNCENTGCPEHNKIVDRENIWSPKNKLGSCNNPADPAVNKMKYVGAVCDQCAKNADPKYMLVIGGKPTGNDDPKEEDGFWFPNDDDEGEHEIDAGAGQERDPWFDSPPEDDKIWKEAYTRLEEAFGMFKSEEDADLADHKRQLAKDNDMPDVDVDDGIDFDEFDRPIKKAAGATCPQCQGSGFAIFGPEGQWDECPTCTDPVTGASKKPPMGESLEDANFDWERRRDAERDDIAAGLIDREHRWLPSGKEEDDIETQLMRKKGIPMRNMRDFDKMMGEAHGEAAEDSMTYEEWKSQYPDAAAALERLAQEHGFDIEEYIGNMSFHKGGVMGTHTPGQSGAYDKFNSETGDFDEHDLDEAHGERAAGKGRLHNRDMTVDRGPKVSDWGFSKSDDYLRGEKGAGSFDEFGDEGFHTLDPEELDPGFGGNVSGDMDWNGTPIHHGAEEDELPTKTDWDPDADGFGEPESQDMWGTGPDMTWDDEDETDTGEPGAEHHTDVTFPKYEPPARKNGWYTDPRSPINGFAKDTDYRPPDTSHHRKGLGDDGEFGWWNTMDSGDAWDKNADQKQSDDYFGPKHKHFVKAGQE